jgi:lysozyme
MDVINTLNTASVDLIKSFEGCSLEVYHGKADAPDVFSIGFGHTAGVTADTPPITQEQADQYLKDDLSAACIDVENAIYAELNDNQYGALVSLVYNVGDAPLRGTLGNRLNANDYDAASNEFLRWNHANGQVVDGLSRRRTAERTLFLTPIDTNS